MSTCPGSGAETVTGDCPECGLALRPTKNNTIPLHMAGLEKEPNDDNETADTP